MFKYLVFVSVMCLLYSCNNSNKVDTEAEQKILLETDNEWSKVVASGDMKQIFEYWTDDAVIYPVGLPVVEGKAAIRKYVKNNRSGKNFSLMVYPLKATVSKAGDIGYTIENYQVSIDGPDGKPVAQKGRSLCVWRKGKDGSWKCNLEIHSPLGMPPDIGTTAKGKEKKD
jgi:ketosteroid isomerase-like protein